MDDCILLNDSVERKPAKRKNETYKEEKLQEKDAKIQELQAIVEKASVDDANMAKKTLRMYLHMYDEINQKDEIISAMKTTENELQQQLSTKSEEIISLELKCKELEQREIDDLTANQCDICMETQKDTAFECGHRCCFECGLRIETCHMCKRPIRRRIKLFK